MNIMVNVSLNVKRLDLAGTPMSVKQIEIDPHVDINGLKNSLNAQLNIKRNDVVYKLRNKQDNLIPLIMLLKGNTADELFILEVVKMHSTVPLFENCEFLTSVYAEATNDKLKLMTNRLDRLEQLAPTLQWRQQAHVEKIVHRLSSRIEFLDRRIEQRSADFRRICSIK